ncbi:MAG: enoyl-CoA hydratase-related protein [Polyangiales bacterium]
MALVKVSVDAGIARLTLDDPRKLNPLTVQLQEELLAGLEQARAAEVRVLVLAAEGRGFCVGADLSTFEQTDFGGRSPGAWLADGMEKLTNRVALELRAFPAPVLSVVQGPAVGAGVGLALAADLVLAAESAYFALPFVPSLGIAPDMGTSWSYPRALGRARAAGLMLLGDRLPAREAERQGLIWRACADAELASEAELLIQRLALLPPHAAQEVRAALDHADEHAYAEQLDYERLRQGELVERPSFAEGVLAFREKRAPKFR